MADRYATEQLINKLILSPLFIHFHAQLLTRIPILGEYLSRSEGVHTGRQIYVQTVSYVHAVL